MPGDGSGGACDGSPMFGEIGFTSPTQAYNDAFNSCVMGMAAARGWMRTNEGMTASGYPPGGGKYCVAAGESDESPPTPEEAPSPTEETEAETNFREAKNEVKDMLPGVRAFVNELFGWEVITQDDLDRAITAVDNAQMWETRHIDPDGKGETLGETSNGGRTIFVSGPMCANDGFSCTVTLLHEALHSALTGTEFGGAEVEHGFLGKELQDATRFYLDYQRYIGEFQKCLQDDPNCTGGCSSREAAMPDCVGAGLTAMGERMREIGQDAEDCATDACWNPAKDEMPPGKMCGDPNPCQGQSVALCMPDQPDCMCNTGNRGLDLKAIIRNMVWNEYCQRAIDDRCGSPTAPLDFGALESATATSRPAEGGAPLRAQPMKAFRFGNLTVHAKGILRMTAPTALSTGAIDSECVSASCRASQRGDW